MSSGIGSLPRARYSRAKRAAVLAASASVLTGTTIALPAASFAGEVADPAPVVNLDLADSALTVPDPVPLPDVEAAGDDLLIAPVSGALNLSGDIDTTPDVAPAAPTTTEPAAATPTTTAPSTAAPSTAAPTLEEPALDAPVVAGPAVPAPAVVAPALPVPAVPAPAVTEPALEPALSAVPDATVDGSSFPAWTNIWPALTLPNADVPTRYDDLRPSGERTEPASAVAAPTAERTAERTAETTTETTTERTAERTTERTVGADKVGAATPVAIEAVERRVADERAERRADRAAAEAVAAAKAQEAEEAEESDADEAAGSASDSKGGLGLAAPLTDLGPRGVETVDLAARNAPDSSMGDWNLMPEVLFAAVPLFLAGAAVAAHGRRNAAAANAGVIRGRHASQ